MLAPALAVLAVLSGLLMLWQWLAAARFPLDRRAPVHPPLPSISALKPLKGADPGTAEALATWLTQDYPGRWEVIFGVESADDPGVELLRGLLARHPEAPARIVVCPEDLGHNRKVSNLTQMARHATGAFLVVSDADVCAPADLLQQLVAPFHDAEVGLAHCLYRFCQPATPASRWEAFIVNADFWSQVLQDQTFTRLDYALGAVMAFRQADLDRLGGFPALADYLADDNRLGRLMVEAGKRTRLCPVVVDCREAPEGWGAVWRHQQRWAVTIRVCQPLPYFLSILANGTVWPVLAAAATPAPAMLALTGILVGLRILQGLSLEARFTRRPPDWARWWLVPLKDFLQVGLWLGAHLQDHVEWRGRRFRVREDGRLVPVVPAAASADEDGAEPARRPS